MIIEESAGATPLQTFSGKKWFLDTNWTEAGDSNSATWQTGAGGNPPDIEVVLHFGFTSGTSNSASVDFSRVYSLFRILPVTISTVSTSFTAQIEYGNITASWDETETLFTNLTTTTIDTDDLAGSCGSQIGGAEYNYRVNRLLSGGTIYGVYYKLKNITLTTGTTSRRLDYTVDAVGSPPVTYYT